MSCSLKKAEQEAALQALMDRNYREMAEAHGAHVRELEIEGNHIYATIEVPRPLTYINLKLSTGDEP